MEHIAELLSRPKTNKRGTVIQFETTSLLFHFSSHAQKLFLHSKHMLSGGENVQILFAHLCCFE